MKKIISIVFILTMFLIIISCYKEQDKSELNSEDVEFIVTFMVDDEIYFKENIKDGNKIIEPTKPIKEKYVFVGWYQDLNSATSWNFLNDVVKKDITLYAKWTLETYTIEYETNNHGDKPDSLQNVLKIPETLPELTEDGYLFEGWYLDNNFFVKAIENTEITKNIILYAKWTLKTYTIEYETNNHGDKPNSLQNVLNLPETLPELTEDGYLFEGWYLDNTFEVKAIENTKINKNVTLYAKWKELYQVSFEINGYGNQPDNLSNLEVIDIKNLPILTDNDWDFEGWYLDNSFEIKVTENIELEKDIILYAKWNIKEEYRNNLSAAGYFKSNSLEFEKYKNTDYYRTVKTPEELVKAINDAKCHYQNKWDDETNTYQQLPAEGYTTKNMFGKVKVIEILNDMDFGYYKLSNTVKNSGVVEDFCRKTQQAITKFTMSDMFKEYGMTQIKVENITELLIYSKNGVKLTHCGFKLTSDHNVIFRNLEFDEIWQWEDASSTSTSNVGDYDAFGWAYFKIAFCGYIWIDHCTFGKSYDGQIDYSNPDYTANAGVAFRAPYGATGDNGLHISWCNFNAGSDDQEGYIYQMMKNIEDEYKAGKNNYLYYNQLRNKGATFEDILYGLAIPQKKGFLCGDSGDNNLDYQYNLKLQISFANCIFKNFEDRIPKLRGGNAYIYNCILDSSQYYSYRSNLQKINAKSAISSLSSSWKCGLVSQGLLCSNGGSVMAENCKFLGIENLLKNNDSLGIPKGVGGYKIVNCSYQLTPTSNVLDKNFPNSSSNMLKESEFSWHTENGEKPFKIIPISLENLADYLNHPIYGIGHKTNENLDFTKVIY